jgi:quinoprotein glucose dehydrogenase
MTHLQTRKALGACAIIIQLAIPSQMRAGDLVATTFAGNDLVQNATAVSVDSDGTVYVVQTDRRKGGEWSEGPQALSYTFNTLAEKRAWLEANPLAHLQGARDNNNDGKVNAADLVTNAEVIHRLRDTTGDGKADQHAIFSNAFNDKMDGIGGGVLARNGEVWFTCFPTLWKLNSKAERTPLLTGFAVKIGQRGHDMHGLRFGPYGRLYWTIGDRGLHVEQNGKTFAYPYHGAVLRSEADGSNFEVFASGCRNAVEIAFDNFGNWIAADNDGDMKGERERLVHYIEGSDHGWRRNWQFQRRYNPWVTEKYFIPHFPGQAAHITPTIANLDGGPCGFTFEPGTALNDDWLNAFILCYAPNTRLDALWLEPSGASFKLKKTKRLTALGCPSGINFGPDGALYLADWGGGWNRNNKGGVIKIDDPQSAGSAIRIETAALLAKLPGDPDALIKLLSHPDQRVRLEAQFALAEKRETKRLKHCAGNAKQPLLGRIHAIWGLAQAHRAAPLDDITFLQPLLVDSKSELRNQAAKACREIPHASLAAHLVERLQDEPRIQMHAAMALGRCGNADHLPALIALLASTEDPFIRHGAVLALTELGSPATLQSISTHPNPAARVGAVVALRRMRAPEVRVFLDDPDTTVLREAARAIHDDGGIAEAMADLAGLQRSSLQDEAIGRRVLNANVRLGTTKAAQTLAAFAMNMRHANKLRIEAIDCLRTWTNPETFDRVNGRLVNDPKGTLEDAQAATRQLADLLNDPDNAIQTTIAKLGKTHGVTFSDDFFLAWLSDPNQQTAAKLQALRILAVGENAEQSFSIAIKDPEPEIHADAIRRLAGINASTALAALETRMSEATTTAPLQIYYRTLRDWPDASAIPLMQKHLTAIASVPTGAQFELHQAAQKHKLTQAAAPGAYLLAGGNAAAGRTIFNEHAVAQCIRCHRTDAGPGSDFGPDLSLVSRRLSPAQLLSSMLNPNADIAEGFTLVTLETKSETLAGNVIKEDARTLTLVDPAGKKHSVTKSDITNRSEVKVSTMPPMGDILTPREQRDLIAYMSTLR